MPHVPAGPARVRIRRQSVPAGIRTPVSCRRQPGLDAGRRDQLPLTARTSTDRTPAVASPSSPVLASSRGRFPALRSGLAALRGPSRQLRPSSSASGPCGSFWGPRGCRSSPRSPRRSWSACGSRSLAAAGCGGSSACLWSSAGGCSPLASVAVVRRFPRPGSPRSCFPAFAACPSGGCGGVSPPLRPPRLAPRTAKKTAKTAWRWTLNMLSQSDCPRLNVTVPPAHHPPQSGTSNAGAAAGLGHSGRGGVPPPLRPPRPTLALHAGPSKQVYGSVRAATSTPHSAPLRLVALWRTRSVVLLAALHSRAGGWGLAGGCGLRCASAAPDAAAARVQHAPGGRMPMRSCGLRQCPRLDEHLTPTHPAATTHLAGHLRPPEPVSPRAQPTGGLDFSDSSEISSSRWVPDPGHRLAAGMPQVAPRHLLVAF